MDIADFLVFFIWIFIFYIFFAIRRKRFSDPVLKAYHKKTFWIKVIGSFAFCLFLLFISPGDATSLYFPEGRNIYHLILKDPSHLKILFEPGKDFDQNLLYDNANAGFFNEESNFMVTRLVAIMCFFTFGKFMAINLFFSMLAFAGVWRLYLFFYDLYPHLHKQLAIAILYLPTFVFWSSGILKDPLCVGALGFLSHSLYCLFIKKKGFFKNVFIILVSGWLLSILKVYILVSYLPFFILFLILFHLKRVKNIVLKIAVVLFFVTASVIGFVFSIENIQSALGNFIGKGSITKTIKSYQQNYNNQQSYAESNFSLGVEFDGTPQSLLKMAPAAIVATLYRPYLWESKKLSTLLSSLESMVIMIFTLFVIIRVGIIKFIKTIARNPVVLYCMLFAMLFSLFVGATTLNFGSLVRYKIPAMPFYVIALFVILDVNGKIKRKPVLTV